MYKKNINQVRIELTEYCPLAFKKFRENALLSIIYSLVQSFFFIIEVLKTFDKSIVIVFYEFFFSKVISKKKNNGIVSL